MDLELDFVLVSLKISVLMQQHCQQTLTMFIWEESCGDIPLVPKAFHLNADESSNQAGLTINTSGKY